MKRLVAQAQRIAPDRGVELGTRGAEPFTHQSLIAAEGPQPISRRGLAGSDAQVAQQIANAAAAGDVQSRRHRSPFHKVEMAIDKARRNRASSQPNQMGPRPY